MNTRGAKSVTAYIHVQAQRASVCRLAPALFFLQRGQPRHWDLGLREQETRDASCTVFSEDGFCSRCLVKPLPLNHAAVTITLQSLWTLVQFFFAPVVFALMSGNLTLVDGAEKEKKTMLFMLFISWLPPVFLLILQKNKHTH